MPVQHPGDRLVRDPGEPRDIANAGRPRPGAGPPVLGYGVPLHITSMAYRTRRRVFLTARLFWRRDARQEAGYLAEQRVAVAAAREPQRMVARLLEVPSACDPFRQVAALKRRRDAVAEAVDHQCRHVNR